MNSLFVSETKQQYTCVPILGFAATQIVRVTRVAHVTVGQKVVRSHWVPLIWIAREQDCTPVKYLRVCRGPDQSRLLTIGTTLQGTYVGWLGSYRFEPV